MSTGLVHLHNLLRWVILILLVVSIFQAFTKKEGLKKTSLFLMISAHITLLLGLFQYFTSEVAGFKMIERVGGMANVMKDPMARFWVVEHISVMFLSIVLITIARRKAKVLQYKPTLILLAIAFLLIMAGVPWPFREAIARPLFPTFKEEALPMNSKDCIGNKNCISDIRENFSNSGKTILGEEYLDNGKFGISFIDAKHTGTVYNATIITDCNCNLKDVNVSAAP